MLTPAVAAAAVQLSSQLAGVVGLECMLVTKKVYPNPSTDHGNLNEFFQ